MTTKKLLITIFSIVGTLFLLVALFVGAILGLAYYAIGHSEAAETARNFLKQNEKLKQDIGEVRDFGSFITGSLNTQNADGNATLYLKVIGARRNVNATVSLISSQGRAWRVTDAAYVNEAGQTVYLLDKYEETPP
ncbi:MAG TPA: cytochrome c oxidase assembly factor Coa1 family protein [Pyrinomonadaceae bacterium]